LAITGGIPVVLAIWFARWKYVRRETCRPAVEFS